MRAALLLLAACAAQTTPDLDSDSDSDALDTQAVGTCPDTRPITPPACGTGPVDRGALLPGPASADHDAALAAKALRTERLFHALVASQTGVNSELTLAPGDTAAREAITAFLDGDGWDLAASAGVSVPDLVASGGWTKVAGGYGGPGIAADAFRYGVLRDEGAPCEEVERARTHLLRSLDTLHLASAITGVPGVIARGFARTDVPGYGRVVQTVPLFDGEGNPLPPEKDNGTWRADQSGAYPEWAWEDSCSRDMFIGWAAAYGGAWEVIGRDPTIPDAVKTRMQADAAALARSLATVQDSGFDLDIMDADGRRTYHGLLTEQSIDRAYVEGFRNGPNAMMALGAVASLTLVAQDPELDAWLADTLLAERELHLVALEGANQLDFGTQTNFSGYNMAFLGSLLAQRYLCDDEARATLADATRLMYDLPDRERQPAEQEQGLYDLAAVLAGLGQGAWSPSTGSLDEVAVGHMLTTLTDFPAAPAWDHERINCDEAEQASGDCTAVDGTKLTVLPGDGRNGTIIAAEPVPMRIRPPSNYYWRSNPYQVNGGGSGDTLLPGVDFRVVYWTGRWARR